MSGRFQKGHSWLNVKKQCLTGLPDKGIRLGKVVSSLLLEEFKQKWADLPQEMYLMLPELGRRLDYKSANVLPIPNSASYQLARSAVTKILTG